MRKDDAGISAASGPVERLVEDVHLLGDLLVGDSTGAVVRLDHVEIDRDLDHGRRSCRELAEIGAAQAEIGAALQLPLVRLVHVGLGQPLLGGVGGEPGMLVDGARVSRLNTVLGRDRGYRRCSGERHGDRGQPAHGAQPPTDVDDRKGCSKPAAHPIPHEPSS